MKSIYSFAAGTGLLIGLLSGCASTPTLSSSDTALLNQALEASKVAVNASDNATKMQKMVTSELNQAEAAADRAQNAASQAEAASERARDAVLNAQRAAENAALSATKAENIFELGLRK